MSEAWVSIAELKQPDGWYKTEDGCDYETAADVLSTRLEFCGCGMPETALRYVHDLLKLLEEWRILDYPTWSAKVKAFFHDDYGAEYFAWYYLDHLELSEHGGSVPGWLTDRGKVMLADLKAYLATAEEL